MSFSFVPLDLNNAKSVAAAVLFRRDCHVVAMGHDEEWIEMSGFDGGKYIDYLRKTVNNPAGFVVQVLDQDKYVGQVEGRYLAESNTGYVNLYYLIPEYRHKGHGKNLEDYVLSRFKDKPVKKMQLTIWHESQPSLAFYKKHGWTMGEQREKPGFFFMEKPIVSSEVSVC